MPVAGSMGQSPSPALSNPFDFFCDQEVYFTEGTPYIIFIVLDCVIWNTNTIENILYAAAVAWAPA